MDKTNLPPLPKPHRRAVFANAANTPLVKSGHEMGGYAKTPAYYTADQMREYAARAVREAVPDTARLDYIERKFSGMTNRERYLPVQMIWGKGCNGRSLREACDKYMARDAAAPTQDQEPTP